MKLKSTILILMACLYLQVGAQEQLREIDEYIIRARQDWGIPGMAVAIVKNGEVLLSRGYGVKESGTNDRVDEATLFAIASNTKAFTSAALATLVNHGAIRWTDKVKDYLPAFELYDDYSTSKTTIEDLLCHRVGLGTFSGDLMWYKSEVSSLDLIGKLKYVPQEFGFRDGYGYSNLMYITAGEIIKKVSGRPWDEYIDSVFFTPLGMDQTVTSTLDLASLENVAMPHKPYLGGNQVLDWVNWDNMGAAGGIISNAKDMAQWMIMHLNGGISKVDTLLPPDQHQTMWNIHNPLTVSAMEKSLLPGITYKGYGLGWKVNDYRNVTLISHSGGYDGMYSKVLMVPEKELGIVILTNSMKSISDPLGYYIIDRMLGEEVLDWSSLLLNYQGNSDPGRVAHLMNARVKKTKPTLPPENYPGIYYSGMHGEVEITPDGKNLRLVFKNAPKLNATLTYWHDDTWLINWDEPHAWFDFGLVQFLPDTDRSVKGLHFDVPNHDIFFDEVDLVKIR